MLPPPTVPGLTALIEKPPNATSGTFSLHSAGRRDLTGAVPGWVTRRELGAVGHPPGAAHNHMGPTNPLPDCKCPVAPEQHHVISQSEKPQLLTPVPMPREEMANSSPAERARCLAGLRALLPSHTKPHAGALRIPSSRLIHLQYN